MQTFNSFNELAAGQGQPLVSGMSVFNAASSEDVGKLQSIIDNLQIQLQPFYSRFRTDDKELFDALDDFEPVFKKMEDVLGKRAGRPNGKTYGEHRGSKYFGIE